MSVQSARSSQHPGSWAHYEPPEDYQETEETFFGANQMGLDEDDLYGEDSYNPNYDMTNYEELERQEGGH